MIAYVLRDGEGSTEQIEAADLHDARRQAESWVRRGDYGEIASTIWVDCYIDDADGDNIDRITVAIDPAEPKCSHSDGHDWQAPHDLVGGLKSNPGVWGHDGGVIILSACMRCGCKRTRDTWASRPDTGEQVESLRYEPGAFELAGEGES